MDNPLTILLIEAESDECRAFDIYVKSIKDVRIVGITDNADKALMYAMDYLPDIIIMDLELLKGTGNGITFLAKLGKRKSIKPPYILVTTNNTSNTTHEHARLFGADFIMIKSHADYNAEQVIEFIRSLRGIIHYSRKVREDALPEQENVSPSEVRSRVAVRVTAEIDLIGISTKLIGRTYLIDAIMLVIEGRKAYIPDIALKYSKTDASVERAMQNAINSLWRTGDTKILQRYYTAHIISHKGAPTLGEFIYFFANKLKQEYKTY